MKALAIAALALAALSGIFALRHGGRIAELEQALESRTGPSAGESPARDAGGALPEGDQEVLLRSLQSRVTRLEAELAVLRSKAGLPAAPAAEETGDAPAAAPETQEAVHQIREQVDALMVGEVLETEAARERLKELVQETRRQEHAERMQRWQESRAEEVKEEVARLAEAHDLSNQQARDLTNLMNAEMAAMNDLFRQAQEGDRSHRELRGEIRTLRDETDASVKGLLNEDQFTAYEAMRDEMGGPGRGRRR
ncbi:MAG: hypothetical protein P1V51_23120 [Deltaproteobacteria bacterium]|nr:hypothetical protein [Deltaproteobacteria bacterium]